MMADWLRRLRFFFVVALFALFLFSLHNLVVEFFEYPVNTKIVEVIPDPHHFPAVTICNLNPHFPPKEKQIDEEPIWLKASHESAGPVPIEFRPNIPERSQLHSFNAETVRRRQSFYEFFSGENRTEDRPSESIVECVFNGSPCVVDEEFEEWFDPTLGTCFTFNAAFQKKDVRMKVADFTGPYSGLILILDARYDEYLDFMTEVGFKVIVHHPKHLPNPIIEGSFLAPGSAVYMGVRERRSERVDVPGHRCVSREKGSAASSATEAAATAAAASSSQYSQSECILSGYTERVKRRCRCWPRPFYRKEAKGPSLPICNSSNPCYESLRLSFADALADIAADDECRVTCESTWFDVARSETKWPTKAADVGVEMAEEWRAMGRDVADNFVKLYVYYESSAVEIFHESRAITMTSFFSELGGMLGLLLGASLLSLADGLEFLVEMVEKKKKTQKMGAK